MTLTSFESAIGYSFSNQGFLSQALTHRSFGTPNNERLEFLGDSILNFRVAWLLYDGFDHLPEGDLSRIRANLVNQASLAKLATELGIGVQLRLGEGEIRSGGASRASILADAFEAVLGAIYLDAGFDAVARVVDRFFKPMLDDSVDSIQGKDAKTRLQEWLQGRRQPLPEYRVVRVEGAHHQQIFLVECRVAVRNLSSEGRGQSRRIAEQNAAGIILKLLSEEALA